MSESMNMQSREQDFRWQLMTTVSALALLVVVCGTNEARAADEDADHPIFWIELGGQLEHVSGQGDAFAPRFLAVNSDSPVLQNVSPSRAQNPPPFEFAEEGKISVQPEGSDWIFAATVNYGRSSNFKQVDQKTNRLFYKYQGPHRPGSAPTTVEKFANTQAHHRESHTILDFAVGKDVGLGMFGRAGSSTLNFGVRFAQFESNSTFDVRARPDLKLNYVTIPPPYNDKFPLLYFHTYHATGNAARGFHGIGPSLSWNGSAPFAGNPQDGQIIFDWGANAAVLFGKQRAHVQHQESGHFKSHGSNKYYATLYQHPPAGHDTVRSVVVPDIGGFAGTSIRYSDVKLSLGYRADFFFGAVDGGINIRKSETLGFYGPFVSVSVGIGG